MTYQFKKFEGRNIKQEDRITVTKSNSIGFPKKCYEDNNIKDFKYAVLYYDENQKAIGIQFSNREEEKNKFKIAHSKKQYGGHIIARSFFRTYNIIPEIYRGRYNWEKYNLEGVGELFVIKLKEVDKK